MNQESLQPLDDKELVQLREDASLLLYKAEEIAVVTTIDEQARAVEALSQIKRRAKIVEEKRRAYTDPLNAVVKKIKADFDTVLKPLEQAETIVKKGIQTFHDSEEYRAKEAARLQAEAEAKAAVLRIEGGQTSQAALDDASKKLATVAATNAEAPRTVATQSGQLRTRKVWRYRIVDAEKLPRMFLMPDEKKIKDHINLGHAIEGVEAWTETVPIIMS